MEQGEAARQMRIGVGYAATDGVMEMMGCSETCLRMGFEHLG